MVRETKEETRCSVRVKHITPKLISSKRAYLEREEHQILIYYVRSFSYEVFVHLKRRVNNETIVSESCSIYGNYAGYEMINFFI